MTQLYEARLMPTDIRKVSLKDIKKRLNGLDEVPCHHFTYCKAPSKSLKEMLKGKMKAIEARGTGLCLDCVKSNKRTALAGECRTPHTGT